MQQVLLMDSIHLSTVSRPVASPAGQGFEHLTSQTGATYAAGCAPFILNVRYRQWSPLSAVCCIIHLHDKEDANL
jgi:hypothetical protein